jgi:hypothetical protein
MNVRRWIWVLGIVLVAGAGLALAYLNSLQLFATDPVSRTANGAIDGYDAVSYFSAGRPMRGDARYVHDWNGATWRFVSAENRDAFAADPERYAPQFGGYCAWAVGHGYTAKSDPEAWHVADGRLYLNFDAAVRDDWLAERERWITEGRTHWPAVIED